MKTSILLKCYISYSFDLFTPVCFETKREVNNLYFEDYFCFTEIENYIINHYNYQQCINILNFDHRRNAAKILPIFLDHFLRKNWLNYNSIEFNEFTNLINSQIGNNESNFNKKALLRFISKKNNLNLYYTINGTHMIMKQLTKRFNFNSNLEKSITNLCDNYSMYHYNFDIVLKDLIKIKDDSKIRKMKNEVHAL